MSQDNQRQQGAPLIGVHLDFKGILFRWEYLPQLLSDLASQGINAILLEYEDTFPFDDLKIALDASVIWRRPSLQHFLTEAHSMGIEVIPLQQCLGHLEFLLGHNRYRKWALNYEYPSTLNIADPQAKALLFEMLRQVFEAHPHSRFIHLGMDEAHALINYAAQRDEDVLGLFLNYLDELCALCEQAGKTPIIWGDMLEDHISPDSLPLLQKFKDRVVICFWDYTTRDERSPVGRISGHRMSRKWLQEPDVPGAPAVRSEQRFIEDLPRPLGDLIEPYYDGRFFVPMFQADLWTSLGFQVIGASACRCSADGSVLPNYNLRSNNIRAWSRAIKRTGGVGHIATSWARGTSWCPPNFVFDLCWPLISTLACSMGVPIQPFFPGIEPRKVEQIFQALGRCREDWRLEAALVCEMQELLSQLQSHQYEWQSVILMTRVLALHRSAELCVLEVEIFQAAHRPVDSEWQRRLNDQAKLLDELTALREEVRRHFLQRYGGVAFEEWISHLFDLHIERIGRCTAVCRKKLPASQRAYSA